MVNFILSKDKNDEYNKHCINLVRKHFSNKNINYRLLFCNQYMFETEIADILPKDIVVWNARLAKNNMSLLTEFPNSFVVLKRHTNLSEKINEHNPINENTAVNNGFRIVYLEETVDSKDIDWRLVIDKSNYQITQEDLLLQVFKDKSNIKSSDFIKKDMFEDIVLFANQQKFYLE